MRYACKASTRIISILLVVMLMITAFPTSAFPAPVLCRDGGLWRGESQPVSRDGHQISAAAAQAPLLHRHRRAGTRKGKRDGAAEIALSEKRPGRHPL